MMRGKRLVHSWCVSWHVAMLTGVVTISESWSYHNILEAITQHRVERDGSESILCRDAVG